MIVHYERTVKVQCGTTDSALWLTGFVRWLIFQGEEEKALVKTNLWLPDDLSGLMIGRESVEVSHLMIEIEQLLEELSGSFLFDQGNRWPGNDSDRLSLVLHRPAKVIFANSTQAFKASGVAEAGAHQLQLEHRAQVYLSTESDQLKNEAKIGSLAEVFFCTRSLDLTPTQLSPNPAAPDRA